MSENQLRYDCIVWGQILSRSMVSWAVWLFCFLSFCTGCNDRVYAESGASVHLWTSMRLRVAQTKHLQGASEVPKHPTDWRPSSAGAHVLTPVTGLCEQLKSQRSKENTSDLYAFSSSKHTPSLFNYTKLILYIDSLPILFLILGGFIRTPTNNYNRGLRFLRFWLNLGPLKEAYIPNNYFQLLPFYLFFMFPHRW